MVVTKREMELIEENKRLTSEILKLKEDKVKTDARYRRIILNLRTTIEAYEMENELHEANQKTYGDIIYKLGGSV